MAINYHLYLSILIFLSLFNQYTQLELSDDQVYVGYSKQKINPDPKNGPVPLSGYGNTGTRLAEFTGNSQKLMKDLYATSISIKDSKLNTLIIITIDSLGLSSGIINSLIKEISNRTNISESNILMSCTHTHSAVDTYFSDANYPSVVKAVQQYKELLKSQIIKAALESLKNQKPADVYTKGINVRLNNGENALNFIRHYSTSSYYKNGEKIVYSANHGSYGWKDGKIVPSNKTGHITVADNKLQVIKFELKDKTEKDIMLINWQAHNCIKGGSSFKTINPDYAGDLRDYIDKKLEVRSAFFQGASGNAVASTAIAKKGIKGASYALNSTSEYFYACLYYAEKLGEYILNDTNSFFIKMRGVNIKSARKLVKIKARYNRDTELLNNANYIYKLFFASYDDIAKMICGEYNWGEGYQFPKGVDETGAKLRETIRIGYDLSNWFIVNETSSGGFKCSINKDIVRGKVTSLCQQIGSLFDKIIYSPYHASAVVSQSSRNENTSINVNVSAVSFGDVAFAGAPFEIFDTNGKNVREASDFKMTFILELLNGDHGYLPDKNSYSFGTYEVDCTYAVEGSGEDVQNNITGLLREIKNKVQKIEIIKYPKKLSYFKGEEKLDLTDGVVNITYIDGFSRKIKMTNEFILVTGFDNSKDGINTIVLNYEGHKATFDVEIKNSKTVLVIVLISLGVIILGVIAFIFIRKKYFNGNNSSLNEMLQGLSSKK